MSRYNTYATEEMNRKLLSPHIVICQARQCINNDGLRCNKQRVEIGKKGECLMFVESVEDGN